jgi:carboxypeptidase PM20D1
MCAGKVFEGGRFTRCWGLMLLGMVLTLGAWAQDNSADYRATHQQRALEMYRNSIAFRTAEGHGQVPPYADYLADQFRHAGFPEQDIHVIPFVSGSGEAIAGLIVRYRGDGTSGRRPILLTAHMDVVDALADDWERDPFTLVEEDGYFFGRGTLDDKLGVVFLTATFARLRQEGFVPNRDLIIAFTGDEETGMVSTRGLVNEYRHLTDAEFALNVDAGGGVFDEDSGEPFVYFVQNAEKTYATFELSISNPGGHSSTPRVDNAIYDLASVLNNLSAYRFPVMSNDATRLFFREMGALTTGEVGAAMTRFADDPSDPWAADVLWHHPEYVGITRTTCVATMLRAGHAENALPQSATATVNCRIFPGVDAAEVEATLLRVADMPGLRLRLLEEALASPTSPLREDVMRAIENAIQARYPGTPVIPYMAPYATDGVQLRSAGIPTYGTFGIFIRESDNFAHGLNERILVREFFGGLEYWHGLLRSLSSSSN